MRRWLAFHQICSIWIRHSLSHSRRCIGRGDVSLFFSFLFAFFFFPNHFVLSNWMVIFTFTYYFHFVVAWSSKTGERCVKQGKHLQSNNHNIGNKSIQSVTLDKWIPSGWPRIPIKPKSERTGSDWVFCCLTWKTAARNYDIIIKYIIWFDLMGHLWSTDFLNILNRVKLRRFPCLLFTTHAHPHVSMRNWSSLLHLLLYYCCLWSPRASP